MEAGSRSVAENSAAAGVWMVTGKLLARGLDFITLLLLGGMLAPREFGLVAMALTVVQVVEALLEVPLVAALHRVKRLERVHFDTAFTLALLRGTACGILLGLLAPPMADLYGEPRVRSLVWALSLAPIARGLQSPRLVEYQKRFDFRRNILLEMLGKLLALGVSLSVALATESYWAIACGTVTAPATMAVGSYVLAPHSPRFSLGAWSQFSDLVSWHSLYQLIGAINWQLDKILLGTYGAPREVGSFYLVSNIASIPFRALVVPLGQPILAAMGAVTTPDGMRGAYGKVVSAMYLTAGPFIVGLALFGEVGIRLALDPRWHDTAPILVWLCLFQLLALPSSTMGPLATHLRQTRLITLRVFIELLVRLPAMLVGVQVYGIHGIVAAQGLVSVMQLTVSVLSVRQMIGLPVRDQLLAPWRPLTALLPAALLVIWADPLLQAPLPLPIQVLAVVFVAGAAGLTYLAVVMLLWRWSGSPPGAEQVVVVASRAIVRRLRSETPASRGR